MKGYIDYITFSDSKYSSTFR